MANERIFGANKISEAARANQEAKNEAERKALIDAISRSKPKPIAAATRLAASIPKKQVVSATPRKTVAKTNAGVFQSGSLKISAKPVRGNESFSLRDSAPFNDIAVAGEAMDDLLV